MTGIFHMTLPIRAGYFKLQRCKQHSVTYFLIHIPWLLSKVWVKLRCGMLLFDFIIYFQCIGKLASVGKKVKFRRTLRYCCSLNFVVMVHIKQGGGSASFSCGSRSGSRVLKINADLDPDVGLDFSLLKKTCIPNQIFYFLALLIEVQTFIQKVSVLKGAQAWDTQTRRISKFSTKQTRKSRDFVAKMLLNSILWNLLLQLKNASECWASAGTMPANTQQTLALC